MRSGGRKRTAAGRKPRPERPPAGPPIPLEPVDLLAGIGPGVDLHVDDLPAGIVPHAPADTALPATMTVTEAGKLLRCGEGTIRHLIHTAVLRPVGTVYGTRVRRSDVEEVQRAGVLRRTPERPGE